jgi:hypothetical protein
LSGNIGKDGWGKMESSPRPYLFQHDGQEEGISSTVAGISRNFEISGSTSMATLHQGLAPYDDLQKRLTPSIWMIYT